MPELVGTPFAFQWLCLSDVRQCRPPSLSHARPLRRLSLSSARRPRCVVERHDLRGDRQRPAAFVLLLYSVAKGGATACLARELRLFRQAVQTLRQRIQANLQHCVDGNRGGTDVLGRCDQSIKTRGKSTLHGDLAVPSSDGRTRRRATGTTIAIDLRLFR